MALSVRNQKLLEDVKMGLSILYGAEYFTEEEWVKLDYLIHKGKYVFTHGPATNILEEPLLSFEEDEMPTIHAAPQQLEEPMGSDTKEIVVKVPEKELSSPDSSDEDFAAPHTERSPTETPLGTSAETSSEEGNHVSASSSVPQLLDFSEFSTPLTSSSAETPKPDGLKVGYTQTQLDEVKAFNAQLTKAGQKTRPKYIPEEDTCEWTEDPADPTLVSGFDSPASTDREARISSWTSEIKADGSPEIVAPTPQSRPVAEILFEKYVKSHGRKPRSLNDVYQPNNPYHQTHGGERAESRASIRTAVTTRTTVKHGAPNPLFVPGAVFTAITSQFSNSKLKLGFERGDQIEVVKHVSGHMYQGLSKRTARTGQFSERDVSITAPESGGLDDLSRRIDQLRIAQLEYETEKAERLAQALAKQKAAKREQELVGQRYSAAPWPSVHDLDSKESINAAAWSDEPSRPKTHVGLAGSRFSDVKAKEPEPVREQQITQEMQMEFGKIIDRKVNEILALRGVAATPPPPQSRSTNPTTKQSNVPLGPVAVKTEVCWFWRTGKGCRFTAEECRDLHHHPIKSPSGSNLHMGKPTWGAAADYATTPLTPNPAFTSLIKTQTCHFWAQGKCIHTEEACKYLHSHSGSGIAAYPGSRWAVRSWGKGADSEDWNAKNKTEVNGEESEKGEVDAWGLPSAETGGEGIYRPPHIVALEDKAKDPVVVW